MAGTESSVHAKFVVLDVGEALVPPERRMMRGRRIRIQYSRGIDGLEDGGVAGNGCQVGIALWRS